VKASNIAKNILNTIKSQDTSKKIYVVNVPDELDGAFIFRVGIKDAFIINGIDTSKVLIVNRLTRTQMLALPEIIKAKENNDEMIIPPLVTVKKGGATYDQLSVEHDNINLLAGKETIVLYWDKIKLIKPD
jgi:hypothetical protein